MKFRYNQLGIKMIPEYLHQKLFANKRPIECDNQQKQKIVEQLKKSIKNIEFNNRINQNKNETNNKWNDLIRFLPKLIDNDVVKHMNQLGRLYSDGYLMKLNKLLQISDKLLLNKPKKWKFQNGWTRYQLIDDNHYKSESIDYPLEDSLIFDVEVSLDRRNYNRPTLAIALSPNAWYSWCSDSLIQMNNIDDQQFYNFNDNNQNKCTINDLIPMGIFNNTERLIIGHNVSFDRSFIREQYFIELDRTRFLDTMSLHICVSGLNQEQKMFAIRNNGSNHPWNKISSLNNLLDVYQLYCPNDSIKLSKKERDIFIKGTMMDVFNNFQQLINYCSVDVIVTLKILKSLFPLFLERFPSSLTMAGMLEMSVMYLPCNENIWKHYLNESQSIYLQYKMEINKTLKDLASETCKHYNNYFNDPWLWDLDWTKRMIQYKKSFKPIEYENFDDKIKLINELIMTKKFLKKNQPILPGYPHWFVELCNDNQRKYLNKIDQLNFDEIFNQFDQFNITTRLRTIPKLLKLMWNNYPLYFDQTYGWGYLVPNFNHNNSDDEYRPFDEIMNKLKINDNDVNNLINNCLKDVQIPGCLFLKLPHKDGPNKRVGNPLSKDFLKKISDGTLRSMIDDITDELVQHQNKISYWINSSKRILSQLIIPYNLDNGDGSILPRVIVSGTVTRRAVEPTWLTASNSYPERLGSELKGIIQCPQGYSYVGADVDSQELWIASLIGDAHYSGIQGSTGLGWMTLNGERSKSTDMHSVTASTINITRDEAKVLNYARIYGSGMEFASRFLKQSNPTLSEEVAKMKAKKIFQQTKGQRKKYYLKTDDGDIKWQREWYGGTESHMFNRLEQIATADEPRTPFLCCRISRALEPIVIGNDYMTSRINWVVQSSAVDFLHIILICMKWLMETFKINGRFSISIHDEIRYIIDDKHCYRAALALQYSNLITRSYFTSILNLNDLPESIAFFSSIEIDKCLRKNTDDDCKTPSNTLGLSKGYGIPNGISINIYKLLELLYKNDQSFINQLK